MAHNMEITIHHYEQAEELSIRLHKYLSAIDDRPPSRRNQWYMAKIDDPAANRDLGLFDVGSAQKTDKKASRLRREDKVFWDEIRSILDFVKCDDLEQSVRTFELSKDNNRQKIQHFFITSLSEYLMDEHSGLQCCHPVVHEMLVRLDLIPDIIQMLKLRPTDGIVKNFTAGVFRDGDHWLGVHYHSIRLFCYLLNAFMCRGCEVPRSSKSLIKLMEKDGIDILLKCIESSKNPKADSAYVIPGLCAIVALYDMFEISPKAFGKAIANSNGIPTLGYFLYRDNTMKVLNRIFKRKQLYKFEEYAMKTSPWYVVPKSLNLKNKGGTHFSDAMSMTEVSQVWAYYLRIYTIDILKQTVSSDIKATRSLVDDKLSMKAIMDWFKCPQRHQRDELTVEFTVSLMFNLVQTREIAKLLVTNYHLLEVLEAAVFFPSSPIIIHGYLEIIACLLNEPSLKDKIIEREDLVFAMSNYAFSIDERLRNMSLSNLLRMSRTTNEGAKHLIKYFGPRELYVYPHTFIKTKGTWSNLVADYKSKLINSNEKAFNQEAQRTIDGIRYLDRSEAVNLKERGNKIFKFGDYEAAIEIYSRAVMVCPYVQLNSDEKTKRKNPYLWESLRVTLISNRAQCYMNLKRYKEALDDCNRVITLSGHEDNEETNVIMIKTLYRRAQTLYQLKYYHRSFADISRCLILCPDNDKCQDFLGKVLIRFRKRYGPEVLITCDECGSSEKLRRCKHCTAAYCSSKCQAKAWTKFHKANCEEFNQEFPDFAK